MNRPDRPLILSFAGLVILVTAGAVMAIWEACAP